MRPVAATFHPAEKEKSAREHGHLRKTWTLVCGGGKFPWMITPLERVRRWLLSSSFQLGAQLVVAQIWAGLFTFVRPLAFPESCLAAIFTLAIMALLAPHGHLGGHLSSAASIFSIAVVVPVYAGCIVSLATTPGSAYTGTLVVFSIVFYIPLAALRASPGHPGPGLISAILFGVAIINSARPLGLYTLWHEIVAYLIAAMLLSISAAILATTLVLPSLAGDHLRQNVARSLESMGHQVSSYAGAIFQGEDAGGEDASTNPGGKEGSHHAVSLRNLRKQMLTVEERTTTQKFLKAVRKRSDPRCPRDPYAVSRRHPSPSVKDTRAMLDECKLLAVEAEFEPAFAQKGPQDTAQWSAVVKDARGLLTRVSTLSLMMEGHLLNSTLLEESCGYDMLPLFRLVYSQIALACRTLSQAVSAAGTPAAEAALTSVKWQLTKTELGEAVDRMKRGYWARHRKREASSLGDDSEATALEVRVLFFSCTLTYGIIDALGALEHSLPVALGYTVQEVELKSSGTAGSPEASHTAAPAGSPVVAAPNGTHGEEPSISNGKPGDALEEETSKGFTVLEVKEGASPSLQEKCRRHLHFLGKFVSQSSGWELCIRLKKVAWDEGKRTFSSREELLVTLRSRQVQYGFKFWLAICMVLTITVNISSHFPNTRDWKLYYSFITVGIIMIERVEAAAWKLIQRIAGTLVGGTLAYLIMLREDVLSRPWLIMILVCTGTFVIVQGLRSSFKYTFFLTAITLGSLTFCQWAQCCSPGTDWLLWKARVLNIICGCLLAMGVSWLILPWYASDEHLGLLADAFVSSADVVDACYKAFHAIGTAVAEGRKLDEVEEIQKLEGLLEGKVVLPVEQTLLGLQRDTVYWQRGLLASPSIVERLTAEMRGMIHKLTALELAATQVPWEYGQFSASIYEHFILPMHEDNTALMAAFSHLASVCEPVLKRGCTPDRLSQVKDALGRVEECRCAIQRHFLQLKRNTRLKALKEDVGEGGYMTAADSIKLSSWMIAASKTFDQMMLVARIIIDEGGFSRDNYLTSLVSFSGSRRAMDR